tara:strand:+ start:250 stop:483 length:234 start_codon:yes stop_codon:yes gene_type:complete
MSGPFKMKGSPMLRNFGIGASPAKYAFLANMAANAASSAVSSAVSSGKGGGGGGGSKGWDKTTDWKDSQDINENKPK